MAPDRIAPAAVQNPGALPRNRLVSSWLLSVVAFCGAAFLFALGLPLPAAFALACIAWVALIGWVALGPMPEESRSFLRRLAWALGALAGMAVAVGTLFWLSLPHR